MPGTRANRESLPSAQPHLRLFALVGMLFVITMPSARGAADTMRCALADGFDYPVGKPEGTGYYKSRGFTPNGHLGEDWNGRGGGDSDLGDPIYAIGTGAVVISENVGVGWGNVVIVRHAFRDLTGKIEMVDSLYGHLLERLVRVGQTVERGQLVGKMGSNNGMYPAHLHLEVRKNLHIGMNRSQFARDNSNYYSPTQFISARRRLASSLQKVEIPMHLFAPYGKTLADSDPGSAPGKAMNIPVFQAPQQFPMPTVPTLPNLVLTQRGGKTASPPPQQTAKDNASKAPSGGPLPSRPAPAPAPPKPVPQEADFWSRLKSKLKQGKLTEETGTHGLR